MTIHAIGPQGLHSVLTDLMRDREQIDGMVLAYITKDGEAAVQVANVDTKTACYLKDLIAWSIQSEMEFNHEK